MNSFYLLPLFLGITVVIQGNLNRHLGIQYGLPTAVLINAVVFLLCSSAVYAASRLWPDIFPQFLRVRPEAPKFFWWYLIPGLCGFSLVLGLPWSFQNIGSAKSFILLVTAQILMGLFWDAFVAKIHLNPAVYVGAGLSLAGALVTVWAK